MMEKITAVCRLPENIREDYLDYAVRKNRAVMSVLGVLILGMQLFNICRVLWFSPSGLDTRNNRLYFGMYCLLFFGSALFFILQSLLRGRPAAGQQLYVWTAAFWLLWQLLLNVYDLYQDPSNGTALFTTAVLGLSVLVQMKPVYSVPFFLGGYLLFCLLAGKQMDAGAEINAGVAAAVGTVSAVARFSHAATELAQQKQITGMNRQLLEDREKLRMSLEKHRIIMNQTNDIMFEWDIPEDTVEFSANWGEVFGSPLVIPHFRNWLEREARLSREDREKLLRKMDSCGSGGPYIETECVFTNAGGAPRWYLVRVSLQYDADGVPVKGIGILEDIDRQKLEILHLKTIVQTDALTGLLNKTALQQYAQHCLAGQRAGEIAAMFIIDLDDFKAINDTYGHPCGDYVLTQAAGLLRGVFREGDGIGRIGGDEFAVVISGVPDAEVVRRKARQAAESFSGVSWAGREVAIHCSVGVSISESPGTAYEELYRSADAALYHAKEKGKRQSCLYQDGGFFLL